MSDADRFAVTFAERLGDEVYIYVRGRLIMKRWLSTGVSVVSNVAPRGAQWNRPEKKKQDGLG